MQKENMEILEFRKITLDDRYDKKYKAWSRVYEYPLVLDIIEKYNINGERCEIHNSSWGFEGCHIEFKNDLDSKYNTLHTDINKSNVPNTSIWDITTKPSVNLLDNFDFILNVSTMEEVEFNHIEIFMNMFNQLKVGGIIICTFDLPGLQLDKFEKLFGVEINRFNNEINGSTSIIPNHNYKHLTCGLIVVRKIK